MMTEHVEKIMGVLKELEGRYGQLLSIMSREKQATLGSNSQAMDTVVMDKQVLMASMAGLERQRRVLQQQVAAQMRLPVSALTLSAIAARTTEPQASEIERLGRSLARLLKQVQQANDENRALVQHCLGLVQNTLGLFKQWLAPASVYGDSGRIDNNALSGKLLSGVV